MFLRRYVNVIILLLAAIGLLANAVQVSAATPTPQYGGIYKLITAQTPSNFGWPPNAVAAAEFIYQPCFDPLAFGYRDGHFEPALATSWKLAPDKSAITLTLKKGVKFHDGSDFNAQVVKFNCDSWITHKTRMDWKSVEVVDPYTVRITFNKNFENVMLDQILSISIASQAACEKNGQEWSMANPVGTGAFKFVRHERDTRTVFAKNENYWQKGLPYLDGVEFVYLKDPMVQAAAMRTNKGTCLQVEASKVVADLIALGFDYIKGTTGTVALKPDSANADSPFADKRVRQALEYAIDREALVKAKSYGLHKAAYQMGPEGTVGYDPKFAGRPYDPDKARALLKEAGFPNGFKTKIIPMPGVYDRDEMVIIQRYLAKVGIEAEIEFLDFPRFMGHFAKGWGPNAILGFPVPMSGGNPNSSLKNLYSKKRTLLPSLHIPDICDERLAESLATPEADPAVINRYYQSIRDEAVLIPIHDILQYAVLQKGVHDTGQLLMRHWHVWTPWKLWMEQK